MNTFLTNFKFIIGFIVLVFLIQISFGDKMSERFTLLTLFTMIILNAESFGDFLKNTFSVTETNALTTEQQLTGEEGAVNQKENGRIKVEAKGNHEIIQVKVKDNGIGIPKDNIKLVQQLAQKNYNEKVEKIAKITLKRLDME